MCRSLTLTAVVALSFIFVVPANADGVYREFKRIRVCKHPDDKSGAILLRVKEGYPSFQGRNLAVIMRNRDGTYVKGLDGKPKFHFVNGFECFDKGKRFTFW